MAMTALDDLPAPDHLATWASQNSADDAIIGHRVTVNASWWATLFRDAGLPADLLVSDTISRGDLFALAADAATDPLAAETLLWNTMAWGLGSRPRLPYARVRSYLDDRDRHQQLLMAAAGLSADDPQAAYALLQPTTRPVISYIGAAFFTKYLYMSGQGRSDHPSLILDDRVVASLQSSGWTSLRKGGGWPPATYLRYVTLAARWTADTQLGRRDLVERYLFNRNGDLSS